MLTHIPEPGTFTKQDVINNAHRGLTKQGVPGMTRSGCSYWTDEGLACGIGHCMTISQAQALSEASYIDEVPTHLLPDHLRGIDIDFLSRVQQAHDDAANKHRDDFLAMFDRNLAGVCSDYGLEMPA